MNQLSNIYLRNEAAQNFEKATFIPQNSFFKMADFIIKSTLTSTDKSYFILDVGSGTGRTILNFLLRFHINKINFKAVCFDSSEIMLNKFKVNLKKSFYAIKQNIILKKLDAEDINFLSKLEWKEFDFVFIISVLQYLKDWRMFLKKNIYPILKDNGYLIQAKLIGWFKLLDGNFNNVRGKSLYLDFWKEYFKNRKKWNPEISFSNMHSVIQFVENVLMLKKISEKHFFWTNLISWEDVLSWIKTGCVSSLGSNLTNKEKQDLCDTMYTFLRRRKKDIYSKFIIKWGFHIWIHQKQ